MAAVKILLLGLFIFILGSTVLADVYDLPKVVAVQKRKYFLNDEVTAQASYLPLDALYKYVTVGGAYTHYFSDFAGWEIVNANMAFKQSTLLRDQIAAQHFDIGNQLQILEYYASSNVVYTPLYNKSLLFNRSIVYGETSFVGGVAFAKFQDIGFKTGINLGLIQRYYLGPNTSLRFDFRDYMFFGSDVANHITLTIGYAMNLGSNPKTDSTEED